MVFAPCPAHAQDKEQDAFHNQVIALYPVDWSKRDPEKLDAFTSEIAKNPAAHFPRLRIELARPDAPNAFLYDGALSLLPSKDRADRQSMLDALARFTPQDMPCDGLVMMAIDAGAEGFDVRAAAMKILDCRPGWIEIDRFPHILSWERTTAFELALFTMDDERFLDELISRLDKEHDPYRLSMLIHSIWTTVTPKGRAALERYAADKTHLKDARKFAREMLKHKGDGPATQTREQLAEKRRTIASHPYFHDSFEAFHALTDDMATLAAREAVADAGAK